METAATVLKLRETKDGKQRGQGKQGLIHYSEQPPRKNPIHRHAPTGHCRFGVGDVAAAGR
jgi:hypothetical protein